jgi:hypothetical protein
MFVHLGNLRLSRLQRAAIPLQSAVRSAYIPAAGGPQFRRVIVASRVQRAFLLRLVKLH